MGVAPEESLRVCTKCHAPKSLGEFYTNGPGKWRGDCKDCVKARTKLAHSPTKSRERQASRYGLSLAQAETRWEAECCEICGSADSRHPTGSFNIDHDHKTGLVRGALCTWCNWGLGHFQDSPTLLRKAADYLDRNVRDTDLQAVL